MRSCRLIGFCTVVAIAMNFSRAEAQLVFGTTTQTTSNGAAFYMDVNTHAITTLWNSAANKKVNGMAYNMATGRFYCNDAARLNFWDQGSIGVVPTFIAGMYRTNDNVAFTATGVDGLAWANGNLYGVTQFGSTTYKRGIYQIATTSDGMTPTAHCVMTPLWLDPTGIGTLSGTIGLGGLEYNPDNNLFYITQSADTTGSGGNYTPGIYTIDAFGGGEITHIADFPVGASPLHVDGLAIGGGKLWEVEQVATAAVINIYPLDLATMTYDATITAPLVDATNRASGACWAPNALVACKPGDMNNDGIVDGRDISAYVRFKSGGTANTVEHCAADALAIEQFMALLLPE